MIRALSLLLVAASVAAAPPATPVVTLEEASARALATNEQIRAASAAQERAAVAPWRALSVLGPSVVDTGSYRRVSQPITFPIAPGTVSGFNPVIIAQDLLRNVLSVSQPLYTHQFWGLRDIGRAQVARSDEAFRAAREDVLLAVAAAYYDALRAQALVGVAHESQRMADTEIEHARARLNAGRGLESDLLRAQSQRAAADQRLADASGQVENALDVLARLAGLEGRFEVVEPIRHDVDVTAAEPFVASALARNPDLRARDAALAEAKGEERRRVAELYPTAGVEFDYQNLNHETFADLNDFWTLMLRARVPLFEDGGSHYLDIAEQRAVVSELEAQLAGFRRDLEVDVRRAWVTIRTLAAQRTAAEKQQALDAETYRMLSAQYAAGYATDLDVLTALTSLDTTRANLAAIRYAYATALVQLERLAGTLGEPMEDLPASMRH
jgi:outer membrane protein TolC